MDGADQAWRTALERCTDAERPLLTQLQASGQPGPDETGFSLSLPGQPMFTAFALWWRESGPVGLAHAPRPDTVPPGRYLFVEPGAEWQSVSDWLQTALSE